MNNTFFNICTDVDYSSESIKKMKLDFPEDDFVDARFDQPFNNKLKKLIVVFSTERSGSTFLCDLMYRAGVCLPHEYFQPYNYMPLFAERWGALDGGKISIKSYCQSLIKNRTSADGVLGLNLHGSHIYLFEQARKYFGNPKVEYYFLKRSNIISQAISYEIAFQTQAWSSEYRKSKIELVYNFEMIMEKLLWLEFDLLKIDVYCKKNALCPNVIYFNELVKDTSGYMLKQFNVEFNEVEQGLKKQSTAINKFWLQRFSNEFDLSQELPPKHIAQSQLSLPDRFIRKLSKVIRSIY